jgi:hypothetical protein
MDIVSPTLFSFRAVHVVLLTLLIVVSVPRARAQGASPETAATLFPGGALVSYNSVFATRAVFASSTGNMPSTARPTFSHEGLFNFTWGFHRDFAFAALLPIVTNHFDMNTPAAHSTVGGTGLGDVILLMKYRFYRRDSERGTTQASVTIGPKLPTGTTSLTGTNGLLLPAGLQPGSGSTDFFVAGNWTYTGVFNLKRLVADEDFHATLRSQGTQRTQLGSNVASRFWLSYRPCQSKNLAHEWFIGPELTWLHMHDDRIAGIDQSGSGGDAVLVGITSYVGLRPGLHVWVGADWDVAHSTGATFMPIRRHITFGLTRQFRMPHF